MKYEEMMDAITKVRTEKAFDMPKIIRMNPVDLAELFESMKHLGFRPEDYTVIDGITIGGIIFKPDSNVENGMMELVEVAKVEK